MDGRVEGRVRPLGGWGQWEAVVGGVLGLQRPLVLSLVEGLVEGQLEGGMRGLQRPLELLEAIDDVR